MKTKSSLTTVSVPWLKTGASHNWVPHVPSVCLGLIKSEIRRVQVEPHHVILPVLAGLELLWAAFHQALVLQKTRCHLHSHPALTPDPRNHCSRAECCQHSPCLASGPGSGTESRAIPGCGHPTNGQRGRTGCRGSKCFHVACDSGAGSPLEQRTLGSSQPPDR